MFRSLLLSKLNSKLLHGKNSNVLASESNEELITNKTIIKKFKIDQSGDKINIFNGSQSNEHVIKNKINRKINLIDINKCNEKNKKAIVIIKKKNVPKNSKQSKLSENESGDIKLEIDRSKVKEIECHDKNITDASHFKNRSYKNQMSMDSNNVNSKSDSFVNHRQQNEEKEIENMKKSSHINLENNCSTFSKHIFDRKKTEKNNTEKSKNSNENNVKSDSKIGLSSLCFQVDVEFQNLFNKEGNDFKINSSKRENTKNTHEKLEQINKGTEEIKVDKIAKKETTSHLRTKNDKMTMEDARSERIKDDTAKTKSSIKDKISANVKKRIEKTTSTTDQIFKSKTEDTEEELKTNEDTAKQINHRISSNDTKKTGEISNDTEFRMNSFNIQLLSKNLHDQLFPNETKQTPDSKLIKKCLDELKVHSLPSNSKLNIMKDIKLTLPPIENGDIVGHFHKIGEEQCKVYRDLTLDLIKNGVPEVPSIWEKKSGWTRYVPGEQPEPVDHPLEDGLIFDVEVCVKEGNLPTIATAVSSKAWYSWISKDLLERKTKIGNQKSNIDKLISFESNSKINGNKFKYDLSKEKVVIGHNVSYDRARIKEQYWLNRTKLRFIDTLSLHVCVSGITRYQRSLLKSEQNLQDENWSNVSSLNSLSEVYKLYCEGKTIDKSERNIFVEGSLDDIETNLQSLMSYCAKDSFATFQVLQNLFPLFLQRFPHPVTFAGMLELNTAYLPVNNNWLKYFHESCQTFNDLNVEMKSLLMDLCDQACSLLHNDQYKSNVWLWDQDWSVKDMKLKKKYTKNQEEAVKAENDEFYEIDKSSQQFKESAQVDEFIKRREDLVEKFKPLIQTQNRLPANSSYLIGYPEWYKKLCLKPSTAKPDLDIDIQDGIADKNTDWIPGPSLISTSMQITPKLLSLTWKSLPLHFIRGHGWGYLVPYKTNIKIPNEELLPLAELEKLYKNINNDQNCEANVDSVQESLRDNVETNIAFNECSKKSKQLAVILDKMNKKESREPSEVSNNDSATEAGFIKLPHKDGDHLNVGNPLSRDFINKFSDNSLAGVDVRAKKIIEISRMLSYWRNNHERVKKQFVVWLNKKDLPRKLLEHCADSAHDYGVILPQIIVSGTLTRRAVESTWMTASNAVDERVGSELRAMIQAPDGYSIIGADVDSQELWIASVIGDSFYAKEHGASPLGWMTLSGQKSTGTDMHSITAKAVGISREHAKVINYARIYGAGERFAERLLKQFNPEMSNNDAKSKARKMYNLTKGKKLYKLKDGQLEELKKRIYSKYEAREICSVYNKSFHEIFNKPQWHGGTESAMFNRLEEIATSLEPVTPFLNSRLSRALEPISENDSKFIQTRINWVVQSGAVDFLHLMLVCMRWLISKDTRFIISIHDEIRYLVPDEEKYQTALALHVTNLLTRAFCIRKLNMTDVPLSISFFSSVEIDKVLRKETNNDCKTPSNPYGLHKGYGIPLGESLDISQCIDKANAIVGVFKPDSQKINKKPKMKNREESEHQD